MKSGISSNLLRSVISPLFISIGAVIGFNYSPRIVSKGTTATCFSGSFTCLNKINRVEFDTTQGTISITLFNKYVPLTTSNFVTLIEQGIYDNTRFYRVIKELKPFVIQSGNRPDIINQVPNGRNFHSIIKEPQLIPIEIALEGEREPLYGKLVTNIADKNRVRILHNRGSLSMARSQNPNFASSQFYIALTPLPELDGRYTVFGQVSEGMDIIDKISEGDKLITARVV
uniref:Peptidyl-prolyl cis-trans isomerase n=1 Tax=Paulinella longichromatophora TaxID=1708747 RepID=A0A2H4ZNC8_9EUKA|nr:putative peptidyl-prolyl cis-trans isomerase, cyclophilin type [Paulinella longichromatophora]